ncbi:hypothetical protein AW081_24065 [Escherichia coli]|nr:hypothetical protein AW081_24065 [Escherichia coli]TJR49092.1 hypothetical protein C9Z41_28120 [Escherichia coli]
MTESGYGLAGLGMGKVKSVNQFRLTPGFGGFTPLPYATTECRLTCANAHKSPFLSGTKTHASWEICTLFCSPLWTTLATPIFD